MSQAAGWGASQRARALHGVAHSQGIFFAALEKTRVPMIVTDTARGGQANRFCEQCLTLDSRLHPRGIRRSPWPLPAATGDRPGDGRGNPPGARAAPRLRQRVFQFSKKRCGFPTRPFRLVGVRRERRTALSLRFQPDVNRRRDALEALRQSQKIKALGLLTGGIATTSTIYAAHDRLSRSGTDRCRGLRDVRGAQPRRAAQSVRTATWLQCPAHTDSACRIGVQAAPRHRGADWREPNAAGRRDSGLGALRRSRGDVLCAAPDSRVPVGLRRCRRAARDQRFGVGHGPRQRLARAVGAFKRFLAEIGCHVVSP